MMNTGMRRLVFRFTVITFYATALLSHAASAVQVAPYFYTWGLENPVYKVHGLMDAKQKAGLNAATLAFVISNGTCKASTGVDDMIPDLRNFTSSGGRVIISFGGATGPYLEDACQNDDDLFNQIDGVIQRTGVYSLDFDVEGAYLGMPNINDRRTRVLIRLRAKYPQLILSYTLPVTPPRSQWDLGGLTNFGVELMQRTAAAGLAIDVVNLMTMDYYFTVPGKTQGDLAIACAEQVVSQLKSIYPGKSQASLYAMVGITPMIGINDDAAVFTLDDTTQVTQFAVQKGIGRLAMWSFQRDQVGQGELGVYSGVNKTNFEFYQALKHAEEVIIDPPPPSPTPTVTPTSSPTPKPTVTPSPTPTVNPTPTPAPTTDPGTCRVWAEDRAYKRGEVVMYQGQTYTALVDHTAYVGTNWNPAATPTLWQKGGTCGGPQPTPTPVPTPTLSPTPTPTMSPIPTPTPTTDPGTCQAWTEGRAYKRGEVVTYQGQAYTALVDHIAYVGTNWNPAVTPALWQKGGVCNGVQPTPTPAPTLTPTPTPTQSPVPTPTPPDSNGYCAPNWNAGTVYHAGQIVGYLGKAYQAITDTWGTPPDSTIYKNWNLIGAINNDLCPVPIPNPINYGSPQVVGGNPNAGINPTSPVSIAHPVTGDSTEPAGKLGAVNPAQDRGGNHPGFNADTGGRVAKLPPGTLPPQHNTYQLNSGKELVAYIGDWAVYGRQFDFRTIPAENLSRIVYGFAGICYPAAKDTQDGFPNGAPAAVNRTCAQSKVPDGAMAIADFFAAFVKVLPGQTAGSLTGTESMYEIDKDAARGVFGLLYSLRKQNPKLKLDLSIGGWTLSEGYPWMASNSTRRKAFVDSIVHFLQQFDFDGVDIDWEYPGTDGAVPGMALPDDPQNYLQLVKDLRAGLDWLTRKTGKPYRLSSAIPATQGHLDKLPIGDVAQFLDRTYAMTYDLTGSWDRNLTHHTPLYTNPNANGSAAGGSVDFTMQYLIRKGVPANKIMLGVANYHRSKAMNSSDVTEYTRGLTGSSSFGNANWIGIDLILGIAGIGTWEAGVVEGYDLYQNYLDRYIKPRNGYKLYTDQLANADYLISPIGSFISVETPRTAALKAAYAKQNGLAGVFFWQAEQDNGYNLNAVNHVFGHPLAKDVADGKPGDQIATCGQNVTAAECADLNKLIR